MAKPNDPSPSRSPCINHIRFASIVLCLTLLGLEVAAKSHYEVLGVKTTALNEEIFAAYQKLSASWYKEEENKEEKNHILISSIIEVQLAFEVLSNEYRRRDYDLYGLDELKEVEALSKASKNEVLDAFPLAKHDDFACIASQTTTLNASNLASIFESEETWFVQIYSLASSRCRSFVDTWEKIAKSLEGVAKLGRLEIGNFQVAGIFAEKDRGSGRFFFRHGLPSIVAIHPSCKHAKCLVRYGGKLTIESILDWCASSILKLPRILYYSPQKLVTDIIQYPGPEKIKVIGFSRTGERATPFLRKAAKEYWQYAIFAFVLWKEKDAMFWQTRFGVESAPAIVFLKDPGVHPIVYHGLMDYSSFGMAMEAHKNHVLPQLRSITAQELGCDASGYSRGGIEFSTWYCVVVVGKPGLKLSQMRGVLRLIQEDLLKEIDSTDVNGIASMSVAAKAFQEKRLSITWLDGEKQKKYCFFLVHSDDVHDTCGPRRYGENDDVPKISLIRYRRETEEKVLKEKNWKSSWDVLLEEQEKLASLLVAKYNGTMDLQKIMTWISQTIEDGDSQDLPNFKVETPALIPEDVVSYQKRASEFLSNTVQNVMHKGIDVRYGFSDVLRDPKLVQIIVVVAALYFAMYYLRPNASSNTVNSQKNSLASPSLASTVDEKSILAATSSTSASS